MMLPLTNTAFPHYLSSPPKGSFNATEKSVSNLLLPKFGRNEFKPMKAYPLNDQKRIWEMLQECQYRLPFEYIMAEDSPAQFYYDDNEVLTLEESYFRDETGKTGVCHELAINLKFHLEQEFRGEYHFFILNGNDPEYFSSAGSNHVFIGACQDKDLNFIESSLLMGPPFSTELQEKMMVIDPSFTQLSSLKDSRYKIIERIMVPTNNSSVIQFDPSYNAGTFKTSNLYPLGNLSALKKAFADTPPDEQDDEIITYYSVIKSEELPEGGLAIGVQNPGYKVHCKYYGETLHQFLEVFPKDSALRVFLERLQSFLDDPVESRVNPPLSDRKIYG